MNWISGETNEQKNTSYGTRYTRDTRRSENEKRGEKKIKFVVKTKKKKTVLSRYPSPRVSVRLFF